MTAQRKFYDPILPPLRARRRAQAARAWREQPSRANGYRAKIYRAILDYCAEHGGNTPTIRELCQVCGISSTSVVNHHIQRLIDEGLLDWIDRKLVVIGGVWIPPGAQDL